MFLHFPDKNLNVESNIFQVFHMDCQCLLLKNTWNNLTFLKDGGHKQLIVIWTICCTLDKHFNPTENTYHSIFIFALHPLPLYTFSGWTWVLDSPWRKSNCQFKVSRFTLFYQLLYNFHLQNKSKRSISSLKMSSPYPL